MKALLAILITATLASQPSPNGWDMFAKVKFTPQLVKEVNEYFLIPSFDSKIKYYEGRKSLSRGTT